MNLLRSLRRFRDRITRIDEATHLLRQMQTDLIAQMREQHELLTQARHEHHELATSLAPAIRSIEQTANLVASKSAPHSPARILFLIHNIAALPVYRGLIAHLEARSEFRVFVASIPKRFPGEHGFAGEELVHQHLTEEGIEHLRLPFSDSFDGLDVIRSLEPDVIFRQSQWEADIPPAYTTPHLRFARLCYVPYHIYPYALVPGTEESEFSDGVWDGYFQESLWAYFCPSGFMKNLAAQKSAARGADNFVVTGHPKVDHIRQSPSAWPVENQTGDRYRIVWDAHHSVTADWFSFGRFPEIADDMLSWARDATDIDFVFTPHPALFTQLTDRPELGWSQERLDAFLSAWVSLPNAVLRPNSDYALLYQAADALITDGISSLAEFQIVQKPVIFLERSGHSPFNEVGEIVRAGTNPVSDVNGARALVELLRSGLGDPAAEAQAITNDVLFSESAADERITDWLLKHLVTRTD